MTPFGDVLEHTTRALAGAPGAELPSLTDDELLGHLGDVERLGRLVDALRVAAAGEVAERCSRDRDSGADSGSDASGSDRSGESLSRRFQVTNGAALVEHITRTSAAEAALRVRVGVGITSHRTLLGERLPADFEHVAAGLAAGRLDVGAAAAIIRHLSEAARSASPDARREAEAFLVGQAETLTVSLVALQAGQLCAALDPDGVEPRENAQRARRAFRLGRERASDGLTPFSGLADPVNAGLLRAALSERTAPSRRPRFVDPDDADVALDLATPIDTRTREQRASDVVFGLLIAGIRADRDAVGSLRGTATVTVVVRAEDLVAGTGAAWIDDVLSPVSTATTHEIICDGGVTLQIEGSKGRILWEGRRERLFTPAQRRAIAVRDGGCLGPQCTAPPSWCHAHHVVGWAEGGPTDVDNGVLLCSFHHHQLHSGAFQLRMTHGIPELLAPPWVDREQQWRPVTRSRLVRAA